MRKGAALAMIQMAAALSQKGLHEQAQNASRTASLMLKPVGAPIPNKILNQRQRRKRARWA